MSTPAEHAATVLTPEERFELRAKYRRIQLHHNDVFYGPMKGATCGCDYCQPIRDMLRVLDDADALAERATELERRVDAWVHEAVANKDRARAAEARAEQLETALWVLLDDMFVDDIDPRLDYVNAQITRTVLAESRAALDGGTAT